LGFSSPAGEFAQGEGTLEFDPADPTRSSVQVKIPLASLNTGVPALDEHFRSKDFFETARFPAATRDPVAHHQPSSRCGRVCAILERTGGGGSRQGRREEIEIHQAVIKRRYFPAIQCYDALKVKALLNEIAGKTHSGAAAMVPALFGMNFQSVYIGQSVRIEPAPRPARRAHPRQARKAPVSKCTKSDPR
jgi:hypothetical protein